MASHLRLITNSSRRSGSVARTSDQPVTDVDDALATLGIIMQSLDAIASGDQRPGHIAYRSKASMALMAKNAADYAEALYVYLRSVEVSA